MPVSRVATANFPLDWETGVATAEANFPLEWETGPAHAGAGNQRRAWHPRTRKEGKKKENAMRPWLLEWRVTAYH